MICPVCEIQNEENVKNCKECEFEFVYFLSKPSDEELNSYQNKIQKFKSKYFYEKSFIFENSIISWLKRDIGSI